MKIVRKVSYVCVDNVYGNFEFNFEPLADSLTVKKTKKGYEASYLIQDTDPSDPFEDDGVGAFYHWKDYGREQLLKYCEALGYDPETHEPNGTKVNPDAVKIDKYEHSQVYYSVEGEGHECRWDTSHGWAVWLPDKYLWEDINRYKTAKARRKRCVELAREACETHNKWANGDVYCLVKETYNKNREYVAHDIVGGYYGYKEALKALETEI